MSASAPAGAGTFQYPEKLHGLPPFFTLQPTEITRQAQMKLWSKLIQDYCRHERVYQISLVEYANHFLFNNTVIKKKLAENDIKIVIDYMVSKEGDERAEWLSPAKTAAWIWWRKPEEWGDRIAGWVDDIGQKGSVLTLYEIVEGEASEQQDFYGMPMDVLHKSLDVLVKKGKAQVFGTEDQRGVKFF